MDLELFKNSFSTFSFIPYSEFQQLKLCLDLKQTYCRDLRDCQTYFPCAVFSNGFSYLYVIKRCLSGQIFDERQQKCIKNTFTDPTCSKHTSFQISRLDTKSHSKLNKTNGKKNRIQGNIKVPLLTSSRNLFKKKNLDVHQIENKNLHYNSNVRPTNEFATSQLKEINDKAKRHRVCYITNWSRYRSGAAKFEIEYVNPSMCSHIIYAYAIVDDNKPEIKPVQKEDIGKVEFNYYS